MKKKKEGNSLETSTLLLRKRLATYVRIVPHDRNVYLRTCMSSRDLICDVSVSHIANCFYVSISQRPLDNRIEIASYAHSSQTTVFRVTSPSVVYDAWALFAKGTWSIWLRKYIVVQCQAYILPDLSFSRNIWKDREEREGLLVMKRKSMSYFITPTDKCTQHSAQVIVSWRIMNHLGTARFCTWGRTVESAFKKMCNPFKTGRARTAISNH